MLQFQAVGSKEKPHIVRDGDDQDYDVDDRVILMDGDIIRKGAIIKLVFPFNLVSRLQINSPFWF